MKTVLIIILSLIMTLSSEAQGMIFPEGDSQKEIELKECAATIGCPPDSIAGTFIYACTRLFIGDCDREILMNGISNHIKELSESQVNLFAKFVYKKYLRQRTGITDEKSLEVFLKTYGFCDIVGEYDEIPNGYGEFGLTDTNPVPTNGIPANKIYLNSLTTDDGGSIQWERVGSVHSSNSKDPIDVYVITDSSGMELSKIYISPYNPKTSTKAPRGYKLK